MANKSSEPSSLARFINGILPENPVLRLVLGICPTLAVTASVEGAITRTRRRTGFSGRMPFINRANELGSLLFWAI